MRISGLDFTRSQSSPFIELAFAHIQYLTPIHVSLLRFGFNSRGNNDIINHHQTPPDAGVQLWDCITECGSYVVCCTPSYEYSLARSHHIFRPRPEAPIIKNKEASNQSAPQSLQSGVLNNIPGFDFRNYSHTYNIVFWQVAEEIQGIFVRYL